MCIVASNRSSPPRLFAGVDLTYLKAHPGIRLSGNAGPATSGRFAVELMKPKLGVDAMVSVPYTSPPAPC